MLIDVKRDHWGHKEQQQEIEDAFREDEIIEYAAVETIAYQHALFTDLVDKGIPCRPFTPHKDKVARAGVASIWQQNGKMYFLKTLRGTRNFKKNFINSQRPQKTIRLIWSAWQQSLSDHADLLVTMTVTMKRYQCRSRDL